MLKGIEFGFSIPVNLTAKWEFPVKIKQGA
jgi:hypothetical protein